MKINRAEIARDLMGLGSIPFLVLVVVRVAMAGNFLELFHIATAVALVVFVSLKIRPVHFHSAVIVILIIFTSIFYGDPFYAVFAVLTGAAAIYGFVRYLQLTNVYASVLVGLVCSGISYVVSLPLGIENV